MALARTIMVTCSRVMLSCARTTTRVPLPSQTSEQVKLFSECTVLFIDSDHPSGTERHCFKMCSVDSNYCIVPLGEATLDQLTSPMYREVFRIIYAHCIMLVEKGFLSRAPRFDFVFMDLEGAGEVISCPVVVVHSSVLSTNRRCVLLSGFSTECFIQSCVVPLLPPMCFTYPCCRFLQRYQRLRRWTGLRAPVFSGATGTGIQRRFGSCCLCWDWSARQFSSKL